MAKFNYKDGTSSVVLRVRVSDTSSSVGVGLTGVTHASSGLCISAIADNESITTSYASSGSTIESITTLGTYAAPTSGKCRFKEIDSTYHPGIYEIQLANTRFNTGARSLIVSVLASGGHCPPSEIQFEPAPANSLYWNSVQTSGMPMVGYTQPTGFLSATFPTFLASPTNITSASGVAVTSLASGIITQIQSGVALTTDVTSARNTITALLPTGLVSGRMNVSVGAYQSGLTPQIVASISGVSFPSGFSSLTSSGIADQVWDELLSGHLSSGSAGLSLNSASSAGDPWSTSLPGVYASGTAGKIIGDNINTTISSRMATYVQPTGFLTTTFPSIVASSGQVYDVHDDVGGISSVTNQMYDVDGSFENRMREILGLSSGNLDSQLSSISDQLPSGLINGSIRSYVYEIEDDAVNVAAVSTGLVSWIQEDLATSSEISAVSAIVESSNDILGKIDTGLQYDGENYQFTENMLENSTSGGLTASGVRDAVGLASANLDSKFSYIPTGVALHTLTESYAAAGSEMTLAQALYMIQQSITEFAISGVNISVKKLDGTEAASYTLNSSTRPSSRTRA